MKNSRTTHPVTALLSEDQYMWVHRMASTEGMSMSDVLIAGLRELIRPQQNRATKGVVVELDDQHALVLAKLCNEQKLNESQLMVQALRRYQKDWIESSAAPTTPDADRPTLVLVLHVDTGALYFDHVANSFVKYEFVSDKIIRAALTVKYEVCDAITSQHLVNLLEQCLPEFRFLVRREDQCDPRATPMENLTRIEVSDVVVSTPTGYDHTAVTTDPYEQYGQALLALTKGNHE